MQNWIKRKWNKIPQDPKTLRNFGLILSVVLLILGGIAFFRGRAHFGILWFLSVPSFLLALWAPRILSYIYRPWMMVAELISWVMLRIILGLFFYFIFSPVAIILRLTGKDLLDERIDPNAQSYWRKRLTQMKPEQYERLF